jgi:23S rRNA (guanine2445-N2)-methyltransferase / 23S rRNA (guanine2069-N7)-methyltransferase
MTLQTCRFLASAPRGLADLLAKELVGFGAGEVRERPTGVSFSGALEVAYRACLGSRIANRVFLEVAQFEAGTTDEFYAWAKRVDWAAHIGPGVTIACDFSGKHPALTHTHFGALKLKDAIVDSLRDGAGYRPDVSVEQPGVRVHAHANRSRISLSIDLSGESLHRRGYRGAGGEAPLKENVAAGVLMRAGWPEMVGERGGGAPLEFLDPMCGSGTFVIEAAMMAAGIAPGLGRDYFGFLGWRQHDASLWARLRAEAAANVRSAENTPVVIRGHDRDVTAIRAARANAERAQVDSLVRFAVQPLAEARPLRERSADAAPPAGLICVNPPYGVRLEDLQKARVIHRELGEVLRERFEGWQAAVLTGSPDLGLELGLRAHRVHTVWNGAIECRLLRIKVEPKAARTLIADRGAARIDLSLRESNGARMFANRLGKNLKQLKGWLKQSGVTCYRLYDADMPEYAFAIDSYSVIGEEVARAGAGREVRQVVTPDGSPGERWLHVQEYAAPASIDEEAVRRRRAEAFSVLPEVTGVPPERIRVRLRRKQTRGNQYQKVAEQFRFFVVEESGLKFRVNFDDYLDTGLFLDHRPTRVRLRELANGKRFLNLFAYTGTATVHAAAGGARTSTSVDLSRTYLDWAERNLGLNGLATRHHELIQADCREWLDEAARARRVYDLIFLDPPTFSNSKRMEGVLDTSRDHPALIDACMRVLAPGGLLVFSTNAQKFRLDASLGERYDVKDVTMATIPRDFERNPRIHRCFDIRHRE